MVKKVQSSLRNMALSLTLICVCAAVALAGVNEMTSKAIADANAKQKEEAIQAVFANALQYVAIEDCEEGGFSRAVDANGAIVGIAVEASSENGFGGHLAMVVGFDTTGSITGYKVVESHETPGLGAKAATWFQKDGAASVIGLNPGNVAFKVKADKGCVDAISGSTITSRAFCEIVNSAYAVYGQAVAKQ